MTQNQLFDGPGFLIATVKTAAIRPRLILWQGRYFVLDSGRYVEAAVEPAETVGQLAT